MVSKIQVNISYLYYVSREGASHKRVSEVYEFCDMKVLGLNDLEHMTSSQETWGDSAVTMGIIIVSPFEDY